MQDQIKPNENELLPESVELSTSENRKSRLNPAVRVRKPSESEEDRKSRPGYIQPHALKELWFHTGTICNLNCTFCFEGSGPGDNRLERIRFQDARPLIDEALELGVERFSFTGGEPFVVKDLYNILDYALDFRSCRVLTNGTDPLFKIIEKLASFKNKPHPLSFRISLDHPDSTLHDQGRGLGNFEKALLSMKALQALGFGLSVARHTHQGEFIEELDAAYRMLFKANGLYEEINIVSFPDLLKPGSRPMATKISEDCMVRYHSEESRREFMCAFSKMAVKKDGRMHIYACTLVDDDPAFDQGDSLHRSLEDKVFLSHHRCMGCFSSGVSCSEG